MSAQESPKAPHNQPFNIGAGIKNKTKKKAWWQIADNNNGRKKT